MTQELQATQADCDAAAQFVALLPYEEHPLVLALARHRQQSTAELLEALREARLQFEYLDDRWPTATTPTAIAKIDLVLAKYGAQS